MKLFVRLFALFLLLPVIELALLVQVDRLIGFWPTIGLILATGLIGSVLVRRAGLSVWRQLQQRLAGGGLPGKEIIDGAIILVAGALLITPGVLTDVLGFIGLFPYTRAFIRKILRKRVDRAIRQSATGTGFHATWTSSSLDRQRGDADTAPWEGTPREQPRYIDRPDDVKP